MKYPMIINVIWHSDYEEGFKVANLIFNELGRDVSNPLKRSINMPIIYVNILENLKLLNTNTNTNTSNAACEKRVYIILVEANLIVKKNNWADELSTLYKNIKNNCDLIVPIAMYKEALNTEIFDTTNFLLYDNNNSQDLLLLQLYSVVYSYMITNGNEQLLTRLKVFVSHTRKDDIFTTQLFQKFLHLNSSLNVFFDATSIMPSEKFDEIIETSICSDNVIFLAIMGNEYLNRTWCKREILVAKCNDIPVLIVNFENENENCYYPYLGGMRYINIRKEAISDKDITILVKKLLLTSIEKKYNNLFLELFKDSNGINNSDLVFLTDCPEPFIFFKNENKKLINDEATVIYPDPPLMKEELSILTRLNSKLSFVTPLTKNFEVNMKPKRVMLSIASVNDINTFDTNSYMANYFIEIIRYLLISGYSINFGGNINRNKPDEPNHVKAIYDVVREFNKKYNDGRTSIKLKNYIASYLINEIGDEKLMNLSEYIEYRFIEDNTIIEDEKEMKAFSLHSMRNTIVNESDCLIAIGGKTKDYSGYYPGIIEEVYLAVKKGLPVYLLGAFGGSTSLMTESILNTRKEKLFATIETTREAVPSIDEMNTWLSELKYTDLNNGLSESDNIKLMTTRNIFETISILLKGIQICGD